MRTAPRRMLLAALLGAWVCRFPSVLDAAEPEISLTLLPVRQVSVNGDKEKFRAHHWMKDGYTGGIKEFSAHHTFPDGTVFATEGHALIDQNDLGTEISLKKNGLGFFDLDYSEFRKYYDGSGGVHRRFAAFPVNQTDQELALNIGKLELETGLALEGWPELSFVYEREFKDGAKSRLTWASVTEAGEVRKIAPSWQDINEVVDAFALEAAHEVAGFTLTGKQRWEFVRAENFRAEPQLATTSSAADARIRTQDQAPQADLMTTTIGAERSFLGDTMFFSSAYHFAHMDNREFETLIETSAAGVATDFATTSEQKPNNRADNDYDSHTWVGSLMASPWPWLSFGTKLKSEVIKRESNSTYNRDVNTTGAQTGEPDGIINGTDVSLNNTKAVRWGEGISVRSTALPRTALYSELEFEQVRILLREDRRSLDGPDSGSGVSDGEIFNRETVTEVRRGAWTLGGRTDPWPFLDVTAHVRRRVNNNDYDDQRESAPGSSTARSAFMDAQNIHTDEFAARATLKPCRWFRSSVRYQFRADDYFTRVEAEPVVETGMLSHIYTYDATLQPVPQLLTTASFSRQNASVTTPARFASTANTPTFNADVSSWLFSAEYTPTPRLALTSSLQVSWADNFNDVAETGLPLGADFQRADLTTGITWSVTDRTSVTGEYAFYRYNPNENAEQGEYTAHAIWLEVSQTF